MSCREKTVRVMIVHTPMGEFYVPADESLGWYTETYRLATLLRVENLTPDELSAARKNNPST